MTGLIEQALEGHWGERCPDYSEGCPCCDAWAQYDKLKERCVRSERIVETVAAYAWRSDPPNAVNPFTAAERFSAIKYHPSIKRAAREYEISEGDPA